jgi:nanoRNase/pAp phosphatase (c-di-AMP/oligoRNAs hydrolase)
MKYKESVMEKQQEQKRYRLVTRSNFDGIVSTALLLKLDLVDEILFAHPKEIQEGNIAVGENDIVTNLPYVENAFMAFDHKLETPDKMKLNKNHALFTDAGSVSEVVYEYYGGKEVFGESLYALVEAANKSKSAAFTKEEVLHPEGWDKLIFLTDPRTGLGRFKNFRISNYALMQKLPHLCLEKSIDEVLKDEDVAERISLCAQYHDAFVAQLKRCTRIEGDVAVIDLRKEDVIYPGNRYMVYALFPEVSASIHVINGVENRNSVFALGKSIFHKSNDHNIYQIVSQFKGGGHRDAGTCQVPHKESAVVLETLLSDLQTLCSQEELCETN